MDLLKVILPSNVTLIYERLQGIVNFELIPKDLIYEEFVAPFIEKQKDGKIEVEDQDE